MASSATIIVEPNAEPVPTASRHVESSCHVEALTPGRANEWDAYVLAHAEGTFFHTLGWRDAVRGAFGLKAFYLTALRHHRPDDRAPLCGHSMVDSPGGLKPAAPLFYGTARAHVVGVLPLFLVHSRLAGHMMVSVPYGVSGGIVADDGEAVDALFTAARRIATEHRCTMIDLRSERAMVPGLRTVDRYVGFRRELPGRVDDVLGSLPRKARAAARNARGKYKLTVSFSDKHLREVWRLYTISMRRLSSLNYPYSFFEQLVTHTPGRHWVSLVHWKERAVAGLVTFLFKDRVMPYFIGTTEDAKRCSAANYIYLTAMERGVERGYRVFDFGRTRRDNVGSFDFKRFQGFEPRPLEYQLYTRPDAKPPNLSPDNPRFRLARRVWSRLPLCVTRSLGTRLARHVPG